MHESLIAWRCEIVVAVTPSVKSRTYVRKDTQPDYAQVYPGISAAEIPSIGSNVRRDDVMRLMRAKALAIFPQ